MNTKTEQIKSFSSFYFLHFSISFFSKGAGEKGLDWFFSFQDVSNSNFEQILHNGPFDLFDQDLFPGMTKNGFFMQRHA